MIEAKATEWLTRKEAARFLATLGVPVSPHTLERWAAHNNKAGGPPFRKSRTKIIRYLKDDLRSWAEREVQLVE